MEMDPNPSSCTKPGSICLDHPDRRSRIFFLKALMMSPLPILLGHTTPGLYPFFPNSHPNSPIPLCFVPLPADKEHKPLLSCTEAFYERKLSPHPCSAFCFHKLTIFLHLSSEAVFHISGHSFCCPLGSGQWGPGSLMSSAQTWTQGSAQAVVAGRVSHIRLFCL